MIKRPKLLVAALLVLAFGVAVLYANNSQRVESLGDELVEATAVLPENEGRLVIVSGVPELADGGMLVDEEAGLRVENALYYGRVPYQKVYALKKREVVVDKGEDKFSEVDDVKETEYYVVKEWIGASHDRDAVVTLHGARYENPLPVKLDAYHVLGDLRVSGFQVDYADVSDYVEAQDHWFSEEELREACGHYITRSELDLKPVSDENGRGLLATGSEVGDVNVLFSYETMEGAEPVTLVGRQQGETIVLEGDDDLLDESERVRGGVVSKEELLEASGAEDGSSRIMGLGALALGLGLAVIAVVL